MKANKFFTAVASLMAAVAFTACSNEELENQPVKSQAKQINLTTSLAKTRAASNIQEDAITSQVGVFGVSNGASTADVGNNVEYTVNSGSLSSTSAMTWPSDGSTSVSFYGYAPYNSEWAYGSVNAFSVATDQSEESAYLASDLLYGVPATNPVSQTDDAVNLAFTHKLAKLTITVNRASGCTVDLSNAVVTITGTNTKTSLNPSTGALAETPS
ncbi:MAG: fimbrillin family protein, partial [Prevotella sp.]|nr:fimbrillin family protein [Prevotella sp.]